MKEMNERIFDKGGAWGKHKTTILGMIKLGSGKELK
jgi:hypothetical protein